MKENTTIPAPGSKESHTEYLVFQYALDPTPEQEARLRSHCGAARFTYNLMLEEIAKNKEAHEKNEKTELLKTTDKVKLKKHFMSVREEKVPWWNENGSAAYDSGILAVTKAYNNHKKNPSHFGKPKFKNKNSKMSFKVDITPMRLEADKRHITLPRFPKMRLHERARGLHRILKQDSHISEISIVYQRTRWFVNVRVKTTLKIWQNYHLQRSKQDKRKIGAADFGITNSVVCQDGTIIENPKHYEKGLEKIRRINRKMARQQGNDKRSGQVASNRYKRSQEQLNKAYAKVTNQEVDFAHKVSKFLVDEFENIVLEDLFVKGLLKNRKLARRIAHASFARLRAFIEYKSKFYGSSVFVADKFFPSSKTCSSCGVVRAKLRLDERVFDCYSCGFKEDRDVNAAINLCNLFASSCGETLNGHGSKDTSGKQLIEELVTGASSVVEVSSQENNLATTPNGETIKKLQ